MALRELLTFRGLREQANESDVRVSLWNRIRRSHAWLVFALPLLIVSCNGDLRDNPPGECGADACPPANTCSPETCSGQCRGDECIPACSKGSTLCGDSCIDLRRSEEHCGSCDNVCKGNETCKSGECMDSPLCTGPNCECASGRYACDGVCVDTETNVFHCGACGSACHASEECVGGGCICPEGEELCGETCVDLLKENKHCGSCGNFCVGGTTCEAGECNCPDGQSLCDGFCVSTMVSREHCGGCGLSCQAGERCTLGSCDDSEDDCGGAATDVDISKISLFQAVEIPLFVDGQLQEVPDRRADIVEARDALVRVHVETGADFAERELSARVFVENQEEVVLYHHKRHTRASSIQSDLNSTFNIALPADSLGPETRFRVELVECGDSPDGPVGTIRLPESGSVALEARETGVVRVLFVPVEHDGRLPDTSPETMAVYAREVGRVFPLGSVELSVGEAIESNQTGINVDLDLLLDDITSLRINESAPSDVYYYGLIDPAETSDEYCEEGCTTGLGWISGGSSNWSKMHRASVGVGFGTWGAETFSHELGHNHGRDHAPCGVEGDAAYPYENAALGSWGYDYFSGSLRAPDAYFDLMSYCAPPWISDYNYQAILEQIVKVNASASSEAFRVGPTQTWARVLVTERTTRWSQSIAAEGAPSPLAEPGLVYDNTGAVIAQVTLYRRTIADSTAYMLFVPPQEPGWSAVGLAGGTPIPY